MEKLFALYVYWFVLLNGSALLFLLVRWLYGLWKERKRRERHWYVYGGKGSPILVTIESEGAIRGKITIHWYGEKLADNQLDLFEVEP